LGPLFRWETRGQGGKDSSTRPQIEIRETRIVVQCKCAKPAGTVMIGNGQKGAKATDFNGRRLVQNGDSLDWPMRKNRTDKLDLSETEGIVQHGRRERSKKYTRVDYEEL